MTNIVCIGDSIVKGDSWDSQQIGWVGRLQEKLLADNIDKLKVYNLGISGDNVIKTSVRFMSEGILREPDYAIISIGMNDMLKNSGIIRINLEERLKYWKRMLHTTKAVNKQTIVLSITPVIESKNEELPLNSDVNEYNKHIKKLCKDFNVMYFDINKKLSDYDLTKIYSDEIHPNDKGYEIMAEIIYKELKKLI